MKKIGFGKFCQFFPNEALAKIEPSLLGGLFIVLATVIAYLPAFSARFIWDDDAYITQNPLLTDPDGFRRIWFSAHFQSQYFPLVYTTFRFEHSLWGFNPFGYHAVNILLHCINALLVWKIFQRLAIPGAWLIAAIFALHPIQVESVAWVTELKNIESTFFYLLALLLWMKFIGKKSWPLYTLICFFYALALFSKTTACTLPAAMLLILWLCKEPIKPARVIQIIPFLAAGVAMGLVSIWWEKHLGNYQPKFDLTFSPLQRLLIATHAIWFYLGKLIWPFTLTFSYPRWEVNVHDAQNYFWPACCLVVAAALWFWRRAIGRGTIAAVIFFVAALSPMLGFVSLYTFYYSFVADHYQYLACVGIMALFAATAAHVAEKLQIIRTVRCAFAFLFLFTLGVLTWKQASVYQNLETLWRDTLAKNPNSWMAHTNLGRLLASQEKFAEAETHYREAVRIKPDNEDVHFNYGNMLVRVGRLDDAIAQYQQALQLAPLDPDIHNNLGVVFYQKHQMDKAIAHFSEAVRYKPADADAHFNLGNAFFVEHKFNDAIAEYQKALNLVPDSEQIKNRLRALGLQTN